MELDSQLYQLDEQRLVDDMRTVMGLEAEFQLYVKLLVEVIITQGLDVYARFRHWFTNPTVLNFSGAEGIAIEVGLRTAARAFVIKVARAYVTTDIKHEALVGTLALNNLRVLVPNFMYVYGYISCTGPRISSDRVTVMSWCGQERENTYLITERIADAIGLDQYCLTCTPDELRLVVLQICNALHVAYIKYKYTHYDAHAKNFLVQSLSCRLNIYNKALNIVDQLVTSQLVRIVDYGLSYFAIGKQRYGRDGYESSGIYLKSRPSYDIWKLLISLAHKMLEKGMTQNLEVVAQMFTFFKVPFSPELSPYIPDDVNTKGLTYYAMVRHLRKLGVVTEPAVSIVTVVPDITAYFSVKPTTSGLEYRDTVATVLTTEQRQYLRTTFPADRYYVKTVTRIVTLRAQLAAVAVGFNGLYVEDISRFPLALLEDKAKFIDPYYSQLINLVLLKSNLVELTSRLQILHDIMRDRVDMGDTYHVDYDVLSSISQAALIERSVGMARQNLNYTNAPSIRTQLQHVFWREAHYVLVVAM